MGDPPRALSSPPSLWAWVTVAILVGLIAIACVLVTLHDDRFMHERYAIVAQRQIASLDKLAKPGIRNAPVVVVLGHSLIWAALQRDGTLYKRYPAGISLLVLTGEFKHPHWFETLLPALHRLRPDLLVVDSELLREEITDQTFAERLHHLIQRFWPSKPPAEAATGCSGGAPDPITANYVNGYEAWFDTKAMSLDRLPVLAALQTEGITVDVLQMPRSNVLEVAAPNLVEWRKAEAALLVNEGIGVWTPAGEWPDADYCDHSHLNLVGAAQFDAWFFEHLKRTFKLSP